MVTTLSDYDGQQCGLIIPIADELAGEAYALQECENTARDGMERLCAEHDCEATELHLIRTVPYHQAMLDGDMLRDHVASLGKAAERMTFLVYRATARKRLPA